jgi:hypothetical protein
MQCSKHKGVATALVVGPVGQREAAACDGGKFIAVGMAAHPNYRTLQVKAGSAEWGHPQLTLFDFREFRYVS